MLIAILNTCSKDELENETPISLNEPSSPPISEAGNDPENLEAKRRAIKNKILAVGRMARVFALLRFVLPLRCLLLILVLGYCTFLTGH